MCTSSDRSGARRPLGRAPLVVKGLTQNTSLPSWRSIHSLLPQVVSSKPALGRAHVPRLDGQAPSAGPRMC
jgi:hypothetical protein